MMNTTKVYYPDKILAFKYDVKILVMAIETFEKLGLDFKVGKHAGEGKLGIRTMHSDMFFVEPGTWIVSGWEKEQYCTNCGEPFHGIAGWCHNCTRYGGM